jgi:hypothetical protein
MKFMEEDEFITPNFDLSKIPTDINMKPNPKGSIAKTMADVDENISADREVNVNTRGGKEIAQKDHELVMFNHYGKNIHDKKSIRGLKPEPLSYILEETEQKSEVQNQQKLEAQQKPEIQNQLRNQNPVIDLLIKSKKKNQEFIINISVEVPTKDLFSTLQESYPDSIDNMIDYVSGLIQKSIPTSIKEIIKKHYAD